MRVFVGHAPNPRPVSVPVSCILVALVGGCWGARPKRGPVRRAIQTGISGITASAPRSSASTKAMDLGGNRALEWLCDAERTFGNDTLESDSDDDDQHLSSPVMKLAASVTP